MNTWTVLGFLAFIAFIDWLICRGKNEQIKLQKKKIKTLNQIAGDRLLSISKRNEVIGILQAKLKDYHKKYGIADDEEFDPVANLEVVKFENIPGPEAARNNICRPDPIE